MARGGKTVKKREIMPDPVYGSVLLSKFINRTMMDGKKTTAQRAVYDALTLLKEKGLDPLETFEKAIDTVGPTVEVKARRIGGAAYQVPTEVKGTRRTSLSIRWILEAARKRSSAEYHTFAEKLAAEIQAVLNNEGDAVRKKEIAHRMAEANKAFSHFRW
jgi:small subunit ribosomal protein S7